MKNLSGSMIVVQFFSEYNREKVLAAAKTVGAKPVKEFLDFGRVYQPGVFGGSEYGAKTSFIKLQFSNGECPVDLRDALMATGLIFNKNGISEFKLLSSLFSPTSSANPADEIPDEIPLDYTPGAETTVAMIMANRKIISEKMFHINQNTLCPHCCTRLEAKIVHDPLLPNDVIFFCPQCEM